jgi:anti-sigma regulatory factor (Ser/Thr protein kinase)
MPLGLMPDSSYEEKDVTIGTGETVLFTTDGIAEAHDQTGEMFGCPRIIEVVTNFERGQNLHDEVLEQLNDFTGAAWEQEDDITMVTLERVPHEQADFERSDSTPITVTRLADIQIPSAPGNERMAMQQVADVVGGLGLEPKRLDKLKTAVAEATMNAIEHGNQNNPDVNVHITDESTSDRLTIRVVDHGGGREIPEAAKPDLELKLAGEQTPRGWGLFLIKNMVDEMNVSSDDTHHTIELVMYLGAAPERSEGVNEPPTSPGGENDGI